MQRSDVRRTQNYQQDNGIVIQFILFELTQAFQKSGAMEKGLEKIKLTPQGNLTKKDREQLETLLNTVTALAGHTQKDIRVLAWNPNEGTLAKLRLHCSIFANNLDPHDPQLCTLQRHAERALMHSLDSLDLIRETLNLPKGGAAEIEELRNSHSKLRGRLKKFAKVVMEKLREFHDNENVLLFLLNNKDTINAMFKEDYVSELFHKMFPKGIAEAEKFLTEKYSSRGFQHLVPGISQKLAELEPA